MLHVAPQLESTLLDLFHAATDHLRFLGSECGVIIGQAFSFNQHAVAPSSKGHEVALADIESVEYLRGITIWRRCPTRATFSVAAVLLAIDSGYLIVDTLGQGPPTSSLRPALPSRTDGAPAGYN